MELLSGIYYRLGAGIPVTTVKKLGRAEEPISINRPDWVKRVDDTVTLSPAQAFGLFRKG